MPDFRIRLVNRNDDSYVFCYVICIDNVNCFGSGMPKQQRAGIWRVAWITFDNFSTGYSVLYFFFRDASFVHPLYRVLSVYQFHAVQFKLFSIALAIS